VTTKVEAGIIREKDELVLMPHNVLVQVKGLEKQGQKVTFGLAGTIVDVGLKMPSDFDTSSLKKGNVLCDPRYPMKLISSFIARVIIYDILSPISKGEAIVVHSYTSKMPGKI
jgi:elongation factor 1 alpha-like protein